MKPISIISPLSSFAPFKSFKKRRKAPKSETKHVVAVCVIKLCTNNERSPLCV